jgi:hypothetical protein
MSRCQPLGNGQASKGPQAKAGRCLKQRRLQRWPMLSHFDDPEHRPGLFV